MIIPLAPNAGLEKNRDRAQSLRANVSGKKYVWGQGRGEKWFCWDWKWWHKALESFNVQQGEGWWMWKWLMFRMDSGDCAHVNNSFYLHKHLSPCKAVVWCSRTGKWQVKTSIWPFHSLSTRTDKMPHVIRLGTLSPMQIQAPIIGFVIKSEVYFAFWGFGVSW